VRFLSQEARWPGLILEGIDDNAMYCIAVIGGDELPKWPRVGISIPTMSAGRARDAVLSISRYYPGEIEFAILANGCTQNELNGLRDLAQELPHMVHLIEESENLGYGRGANRGLEYLAQEAWFDYFAVSNDDVYPSVDFLPHLVAAANELSELGHRPGLIGGVSNEVNGAQKVDIGPYSTIAEMQTRSRLWNEESHSCANQTRQIRGLFALIHPDCLNEVGGFDPRFGKGNFEDDDYNLRCHQAGFTLWQVQGAFLHHTGSATFRELAVDYESGVQRNLNLILQKWGVQEFADLWELPAESKQVYIPLTAKPEFSGIEARINGEAVDLVDQASDLEFAAWIVREISQSGRNGRLKVLQALKAA
jgi:GT2 family glycosyltransferase